MGVHINFLIVIHEDNRVLNEAGVWGSCDFPLATPIWNNATGTMPLKRASNAKPVL